MSLPDILAHAETHARGLAFAIPKGWSQGRTTYGGLSAALALAATKHAHKDLPPLRSAQFAFMAPANDRIEVSATLLRRGRSAAFVEAISTSGGVAAMRALFVFMAPVQSSLDFAASPAPGAPAPETARDASPKFGPEFFTNNFDLRYAAPKSAAPQPDILRWVRLKEREGLDPFVELIAVADALPPAAMMMATAMAPISTVTWFMNFLSAAPVTQDGWWLSRSTAEAARDGASSQTMGLWSADSAPIVAGMQSVAIFG